MGKIYNIKRIKNNKERQNESFFKKENLGLCLPLSVERVGCMLTLHWAREVVFMVVAHWALVSWFLVYSSLGGELAFMLTSC